MWFGGYKQACSVNTLKSLIENMITGVTEVSTNKPSSDLKTECPFLLDVWCVLFSLIRFNLLLYYAQGYKYKMRLVYSHFPINAIVSKTGDSITVRNFLGGK